MAYFSNYRKKVTLPKQEKTYSVFAPGSCDHHNASPHVTLFAFFFAVPLLASRSSLFFAVSSPFEFLSLCPLW
jgi:hypothetical protein